MARWEIQMRSRRKEVNGLGVENREEAPSYHYKRGYFNDWIVCDNLKKKGKKRAEGKHYNVALSHSMKKLVRLIYALQKSGKTYLAAA